MCTSPQKKKKSATFINRTHMFIVYSNSNVFIGINIKMETFRGWGWLRGQECLLCKMRMRVWIPAPMWKLSIAVCVCNSAPEWGDVFIINKKILWLRIRGIYGLESDSVFDQSRQDTAGNLKSGFFTSLVWGGGKCTFNFSHLAGGGSEKIFQSHSGLLTSLFPPLQGWRRWWQRL